MTQALAVRRADTPHESRECERKIHLARRVNATTYHQIQNLEVECEADRVVLTGRSRTYYMKQLATQAILTAAPEAKLHNEIVVVAG